MMPSNVRRIYSSVLLALISFAAVSFAQTVTPTPQPGTLAAPAPTSGDAMRDRISKAKAFIVVRNYNAAINELENLRKESGDPAVRAVVNVLLMNSYLEQGDYKRAQDFLNQFYNEQKTTKAGATDAYTAVAGQVIKGGRSRAERYKALGLNVADRSLPLEALNDLEKMRETLELVITQSKEMGKIPARTRDAMSLLEEATSSRTMIARDDYDAKQWRDAVADTREEITNSRSVVLNAVDETPLNTAGQVAANNTVNTQVTGGSIQSTSMTQPVFKPDTTAENNSTREREVKTVEYTPTPIGEPTKEEKTIVVPSAPPAQQGSNAVEQTVTSTTSGDPIDVGALIAYATRQTQPIYPSAARMMRATGLVRVEITVDESGGVVDVKKTSGPILLHNAAKDAVKKWKFKPFVRDGQAVKANGFINFNFSL